MLVDDSTSYAASVEVQFVFVVDNFTAVLYVIQHAKSRLSEEIEQLDIITYSYRGHP